MWLDSVLVVYLGLHTVLALLIDAQTVLPKEWFHASLLKLSEDYVA
jgi:hypothetical protein